MRPISGIVSAFLALLLGACSTVPAISAPKSFISTPTTISTTTGGGKEAGEEITELMNCEGDLKYIPVPAFQANDYSTVKMVGSTHTVTHAQFPTDTTAVNKLLPNLSMDVSSEVVEGGGQAFTFKSDVHYRKIVMDFMKSRTEPIVDASNKFYGYGRVGAGLRLKIDLWSSDSSFDGSLIGLAASAKAKTAYGRITAETVGLNNSDVTFAMPFSTDFSEGSIQKIIEALAVIKSRLHDDAKTTLVPHFLARVACGKKNGNKPVH